MVDGGVGNKGQDRQTVADLLARLDRSAGSRPQVPVAVLAQAAAEPDPLPSPAPENPSRDLLAARLEQMLASRRSPPVIPERRPAKWDLARRGANQPDPFGRECSQLSPPRPSQGAAESYVMG